MIYLMNNGLAILSVGMLSAGIYFEDGQMIMAGFAFSICTAVFFAWDEWRSLRKDRGMLNEIEKLMVQSQQIRMDALKLLDEARSINHEIIISAIRAMGVSSRGFPDQIMPLAQHHRKTDEKDSN